MRRDMTGWLCVLLAPTPSVLAFAYLRRCGGGFVCEKFVNEPLLTLNVFVLINFTLGLWLHSLLARSTHFISRPWNDTCGR